MSMMIKLISLILVIIPSARAFDYRTGNCTPQGSIISTSDAYQTNLANLLHTFPTQALASGFYNSSSGHPPDQVYALYLCEADLDGPACSECIYEAHVHIQIDCGYGLSAQLWSNRCMLRFSNTPVFQTLYVSPYNTVRNDSFPLNANQTQELNDLMESLVSKVADSKGKYGTAESKLSGSCPILYTVGQCTPDLNAGDCETCVKTAITEVPNTCGGTVFLPSCSVRFDPNESFSDTPNLTFLQWAINNPVSLVVGSQTSGNFLNIVIAYLWSVVPLVGIIAILTIGAFDYYFIDVCSH